MAAKQDLKPKFQEGERVLCFHGPLLYEAKCVKVAIKDKQVKYFIHYSGWNKNWDEWVPESRVLKYVDTNLQKQGELQKANQEQYAEGLYAEQYAVCEGLPLERRLLGYNKKILK